MIYLSCLTAVLAGFSVYCIFSQFVTFPSSKAEKVILNAGKKKTLKASMETSFLIPLANKIEPHIKLEEYRREALQLTLNTAGLSLSAEKYTANAIAYGFLYFSMLLPMGILLSPVFFLAALILGFMCYKQRMDSAQKMVTEKRRQIESELPHFASTIHEQLNVTRDVMKIFESYRKICSKEFEEEITKTLADMKTGNQEKALRNFENRMGSFKLSEVIRGLIGVLGGNNQIIHFEILTNDLIKSENEELRREAIKRPDKLKLNEFILLGCFLLMLGVAIGLQVYGSIKSF